METQKQVTLIENEKVRTTEITKVAFGAGMGNLIEWFDYASYGYLATIIANVFFAPGNERAALLGTFGVFAISFIARPIGGIVWGHYGDKLGRKRILTLTIIMMSLSTFAIGFIPSYTTIGMLSPLLLLLCRLVQGFSASGEYAGASLFIAEYAPRKRRGLLVSIVPASTAAGLLLGALTSAGLEFSMAKDALHSWGWRIPFLVAGPLGLIALYLRLRLEDTPVFKDLDHEKPQDPVFISIRQNWIKILVAFGVICLNAVGFYTILSYMPTYLENELGFDNVKSILSTIASLGTYVIFLPLIGSLADRVGRKPVLIGASILFILVSYPAFLLLNFGGIYAVLAQVLLGAILAGNDGVLATFLSEMFPASVRYTCFGLSFNLGNAIFGGTAPFIATFLILQTSNKFAPAFYLMVAAFIAFIALLKTKETRNNSL
ncbi:MFS transporter [Bacillus salipaludis]|uniref:MFS transporter n=1 Tax=Bacillus salipaludis TaxID=2547811 RepID=UPI002E24DE56|nr:MFS transporter [Bacillus salipaludis]